MKQIMLCLYKTPHRSFADLACEALQREGIEASVSHIEPNGSGHFPSVTRTEHDIYVHSAQDFDRAKQLLIKLGADNPEPTQLPDRQTTRWIIFFILVAIAAVLMRT